MDLRFWLDSEKKIQDDHLEPKMIITVTQAGDKVGMLVPEGMTPMQAAKLLKHAAECVMLEDQRQRQAMKNPKILDPKHLRPLG
jgi:hypothetical protein